MALTVGFDGSALLVAQKTGVERYVEALLTAINRELADRADLDLVVYLHSGNPFARLSPRDCAARLDRLRFHLFPWPRGYRVALPLLAARDGVQLLHLPAPSFLRMACCPTVITVHDLIWAHLPDKGRAIEAQGQHTLLRRSLRQADYVIADSESTRADLERLMRWEVDRARVVPLGVAPAFRPVEHERVAALRSRYGLGPFVLYVAALQYRKNHVRLVEAFRRLVQDHDTPHTLILVGPDGHGATAVYEALAASELGDRVRVLGFLPDDELPTLYGAADLVVYPSLWEGFGLPVLEALACGAVVVASRLASIPEVGGEAVVYCDPYDVEDLSAQMWRALSDEPLRRRLRLAGPRQAADFHWARTAHETLDCYRWLGAQARAWGRPRLRRADCARA